MTYTYISAICAGIFSRLSKLPEGRTKICPSYIDFQIKLLGALSVGDVRTGTIPSLLPSQKHYLKEPLAKRPLLPNLCVRLKF
ncbi:MAG: hypothetical protein V1736_05060 [Pseudomonadota bacterium]